MVSASQQKAVFTQGTRGIYESVARVFQPTAKDPMIVFLISASILALVAVTTISGLGTTRGRRA